VGGKEKKRTHKGKKEGRGKRHRAAAHHCPLEKKRRRSLSLSLGTNQREGKNALACRSSGILWLEEEGKREKKKNTTGGEREEKERRRFVPYAQSRVARTGREKKERGKRDYKEEGKR